MPKDAWNKAKRKDLSRKGVKKTSRYRNRVKPATPTPGNWNPGTKLWFGIHKNKPIKKVPRDYLKWIANNPNPATSWRIAELRNYLKQYLLTT